MEERRERGRQEGMEGGGRALLVAGSTLTFWIPWQTHFS